jgi:hypothetical protein
MKDYDTKKGADVEIEPVRWVFDLMLTCPC